MLFLSLLETFAIYAYLLLADLGLESHEKEGAIVAIPVAMAILGSIVMIVIFVMNMIFNRYLFPSDDTAHPPQAPTGE